MPAFTDLLHYLPASDMVRDMLRDFPPLAEPPWQAQFLMIAIDEETPAVVDHRCLLLALARAPSRAVFMLIDHEKGCAAAYRWHDAGRGSNSPTGYLPVSLDALTADLLGPPVSVASQGRIGVTIVDSASGVPPMSRRVEAVLRTLGNLAWVESLGIEVASSPLCTAGRAFDDGALTQIAIAARAAMDAVEGANVLVDEIALSALQLTQPSRGHHQWFWFDDGVHQGDGLLSHAEWSVLAPAMPCRLVWDEPQVSFRLHTPALGVVFDALRTCCRAPIDLAGSDRLALLQAIQNYLLQIVRLAIIGRNNVYPPPAFRSGVDTLCERMTAAVQRVEQWATHTDAVQSIGVAGDSSVAMKAWVDHHAGIFNDVYLINEIGMLELRLPSQVSATRCIDALESLVTFATLRCLFPSGPAQADVARAMATVAATLFERSRYVGERGQTALERGQALAVSPEKYLNALVNTWTRVDEQIDHIVSFVALLRAVFLLQGEQTENARDDLLVDVLAEVIFLDDQGHDVSGGPLPTAITTWLGVCGVSRTELDRGLRRLAEALPARMAVAHDTLRQLTQTWGTTPAFLEQQAVRPRGMWGCPPDWIVTDLDLSANTAWRVYPAIVPWGVWKEGVQVGFSYATLSPPPVPEKASAADGDLTLSRALIDIWTTPMPPSGAMWLPSQPLRRVVSRYGRYPATRWITPPDDALRFILGSGMTQFAGGLQLPDGGYLLAPEGISYLPTTITIKLAPVPGTVMVPDVESPRCAALRYAIDVPVTPVTIQLASQPIPMQLRLAPLLPGVALIVDTTRLLTEPALDGSVALATVGAFDDVLATARGLMIGTQEIAIESPGAVTVEMRLTLAQGASVRWRVAWPGDGAEPTPLSLWFDRTANLRQNAARIKTSLVRAGRAMGHLPATTYEEGLHYSGYVLLGSGQSVLACVIEGWSTYLMLDQVVVECRERCSIRCVQSNGGRQLLIDAVSRDDELHYTAGVDGQTLALHSVSFGPVHTQTILSAPRAVDDFFSPDLFATDGCRMSGRDGWGRLATFMVVDGLVTLDRLQWDEGRLACAYRSGVLALTCEGSGNVVPQLPVPGNIDELSIEVGTSVADLDVTELLVMHSPLGIDLADAEELVSLRLGESFGLQTVACKEDRVIIVGAAGTVNCAGVWGRRGAAWTRRASIVDGSRSMTIEALLALGDCSGAQPAHARGAAHV